MKIRIVEHSPSEKISAIEPVAGKSIKSYFVHGAGERSNECGESRKKLEIDHGIDFEGSNSNERCNGGKNKSQKRGIVDSADLLRRNNAEKFAAFAVLFKNKKVDRAVRKTFLCLYEAAVCEKRAPHFAQLDEEDIARFLYARRSKAEEYCLKR